MDNRTTKPKRRGVGGARPGAGRPPKMTKPVRVMVIMEAELKLALQHLVAHVNAHLDRVERRGRRKLEPVTASELTRLALSDYLTTAAKAGDYANQATQYRPYLGRSKPQGNDRSIQDRTYFTTYLDQQIKDALLEHLERVNLEIRLQNRRQAYKKDHDRQLVMSEVVRRVVEQSVAHNDPHNMARRLRPEVEEHELRSRSA